MRKFLPLLLVALMATSAMASTAYIYQNAVTTLRGDVVGGASVGVYFAGTTTKATIYSDMYTETQKQNPTHTDGYGRFFFYANPGLYDLVISGPNITTYTMHDVRIARADWTGSEALESGAWTRLPMVSGLSGKGASAAPTEATWKGVHKVWEFGEGGGEYLYCSVAFPSSYMRDSPAIPVFRFVNEDTIFDGDVVSFRTNYVICNTREVAQDTVSAISKLTNNAALRATLSSPLKHFARIKPGCVLYAVLDSIPSLDLTDHTIVSVRIDRVANGDHAGDIYLLGADMAVKVDRLGVQSVGELH
jgi:hypothetical protein